VVNAGGIIDVYYQRKMVEKSYGLEDYAADLSAKVKEIGSTLREIFVRSDSENVPTFVIADRVAEERFSTPGNIYQTGSVETTAA